MFPMGDWHHKLRYCSGDKHRMIYDFVWILQYRGLFLLRWGYRGVNLTTHLLVSMLRIVEIYLHSPIRLHDVMLNVLRPEITLCQKNIPELFLPRNIGLILSNCGNIRIWSSRIICVKLRCIAKSVPRMYRHSFTHNKRSKLISFCWI
jgi:hypothetical protein